MFDRKIITKTYKFIYIDHRKASRGNDDYLLKTEYFFANKAPQGLNCNDGYFFSNGSRSDVYSFFYKSLAGTKQNDNFLGYGVPANEANITRAMVRKFKFEINKYRKDYKEREQALHNYVHTPGTVDLTYTYKQSLESIKCCIIAYKRQLKIWKARYQILKDQGVYTYLELMK